MLCASLARRQPQPRVGTLQQLHRRRQPRTRAERRHHPLRPPLGAVPPAIVVSGSRCVWNAAERRAATASPAASRVRTSAYCSSRDGRSRGARGRARIAADAHHGRLWGRSAAPSASTSRGASNAPPGSVLQPHHRRQPRPRVGSLQHLRRRTAEAARKPPPLTTTAASEGDPRLDPHPRLTVRRTRRGKRYCIHMLRRQPRLRVGALQLR